MVHKLLQFEDASPKIAENFQSRFFMLYTRIPIILLSTTPIYQVSKLSLCIVASHWIRMYIMWKLWKFNCFLETARNGGHYIYSLVNNEPISDFCKHVNLEATPAWGKWIIKSFSSVAKKQNIMWLSHPPRFLVSVDTWYIKKYLLTGTFGKHNVFWTANVSLSFTSGNIWWSHLQNTVSLGPS